MVLSREALRDEYDMHEMSRISRTDAMLIDFTMREHLIEKGITR